MQAPGSAANHKESALAKLLLIMLVISTSSLKADFRIHLKCAMQDLEK